ncbi:MerR family DNA-binding protein [Cupriavidus metallidurans]|uniref:MerR family transcriptional regulator n=1 Tax=Cupriavidus metallidurans TaxID=119219 RepID=A0A482IU08_9BURK|nr:MerR family DNA-binding protein [Cupriavidus metallidurans]QBP12545.1 MerR family transcriptional regulator [Cupriavidus metallidurans]
MNIGEASKSSGMSVQMIRYYERVGLIARASRTAGGYRAYSEVDVNVLRFIRRARDLGLPVSDIERLLSMWRDRTQECDEARSIVKKHIEELENRLRDLQQMLFSLQALLDGCPGDLHPECPILEDLATHIELEARVSTASLARSVEGESLVGQLSDCAKHT